MEFESPEKMAGKIRELEAALKTAEEALVAATERGWKFREALGFYTNAYDAGSLARTTLASPPARDVEAKEQLTISTTTSTIPIMLQIDMQRASVERAIQIVKDAYVHNEAAMHLPLADQPERAVLSDWRETAAKVCDAQASEQWSRARAYNRSTPSSTYEHAAQTLQWVAAAIRALPLTPTDNLAALQSDSREEWKRLLAENEDLQAKLKEKGQIFEMANEYIKKLQGEIATLKADYAKADAAFKQAEERWFEGEGKLREEVERLKGENEKWSKIFDMIAAACKAASPAPEAKAEESPRGEVWEVERIVSNWINITLETATDHEGQTSRTTERESVKYDKVMKLLIVSAAFSSIAAILNVSLLVIHIWRVMK